MFLPGDGCSGTLTGFRLEAKSKIKNNGASAFKCRSPELIIELIIDIR